MLIAGVLQFDELGRIRTAPPPANDFNGGTPTVYPGFLAVGLNNEPDVFLAGIGYMDFGNVTDSDTDIDPAPGGLAGLVNRRGQLRVKAAEGPPAYWYAGLPFTAEGQLAIAPLAPVKLYAYSNAFSNAFDSQNAP